MNTYFPDPHRRRPRGRARAGQAGPLTEGGPDHQGQHQPARQEGRQGEEPLAQRRRGGPGRAAEAVRDGGRGGRRGDPGQGAAAAGAAAEAGQPKLDPVLNPFRRFFVCHEYHQLFFGFSKVSPL